MHVQKITAGPTREALRMPMQAVGRTLVLHVGSEVLVRPLPESGAVEIGRDADCAIVLDDPSVSRRHARLHCTPATLTVEDLGSTNGTRVLGEALAPGSRRAADAGAVIELGAVAAFVRAGGAHEATDDAAALASPRTGVATAGARSVLVADARMKELYSLLDVVAPSPFCVLVLGETGVGKDVFAEAIHDRSSRRGQPFLRLNCAALAESILESELFGHEKGAFTGAVATKPGLFESADGGTVFLDEVGELPASTQAKLLRVLENGEVMRLGSVKTRKVDVRFVSATNRDLKALSESGAFRLDLYFRLCGVAVTIPPLRERSGDLTALATHFVKEAGQRLGQRPPSIADDAMEKLYAYAWPGNIRELKNVMERAVLMARGGAVEARHLEVSVATHAPPAAAHAGPAAAAPAALVEATGTFRDQVRALERERILVALDRCAGNQSRAAKLLGIPRRTFVKRLDAYGIARPRKPGGDDDDEGPRGDSE